MPGERKIDSVRMLPTDLPPDHKYTMLEEPLELMLDRLPPAPKARAKVRHGYTKPTPWPSK